MAKRTRAHSTFDLVDAAEWVSDRTEIDVEIALEILEVEYGYLKDSGATAVQGHAVIASREQVLAVAAKVPVGEDIVRTVLDAFMEYLRIKGYVREVPPAAPAPPG